MVQCVLLDPRREHKSILSRRLESFDYFMRASDLLRMLVKILHSPVSFTGPKEGFEPKEVKSLKTLLRGLLAQSSNSVLRLVTTLPLVLDKSSRVQPVYQDPGGNINRSNHVDWNYDK